MIKNLNIRVYVGGSLTIITRRKQCHNELTWRTSAPFCPFCPFYPFCLYPPPTWSILATRKEIPHRFPIPSFAPFFTFPLSLYTLFLHQILRRPLLPLSMPLILLKAKKGLLPAGFTNCLHPVAFCLFSASAAFPRLQPGRLILL